VEGPIWIKGLGDIAHEIPTAQSVRNQNRLSSKADLEILFSFLRKEMNTKVEYNFVAHNLDTEFALFGFRTWEIWRWQGRTTNQENVADFMETKFASLPRRISCKAR
jgi:ribosome-associated toxin RatA of RatAB toxin-antitoxin module